MDIHTKFIDWLLLILSGVLLSIGGYITKRQSSLEAEMKKFKEIADEKYVQRNTCIIIEENIRIQLRDVKEAHERLHEKVDNLPLKIIKVLKENGAKEVL